MKPIGKDKPVAALPALESSEKDTQDSDGAAHVAASGLSPRAIWMSVILWPSFMVAGVATMVFFAFVDPHDLNQISFPRTEFSRELGYTLGFFLLWLSTATASSLTALLLGRGRTQ